MYLNLVPKFGKTCLFWVMLIKNDVITPLKVDQFGQNLNWRYFILSTTSFKNFIKIRVLKVLKFAFEVGLYLTTILNYIF